MEKIACITGDVHHINDIKLHVDEYKNAERYIELIEEYNAKATLFVTGRCIAKHQHFWKWMAQKPCVELGAHTYKGFSFINKVFDKLNGHPYGPYIFQYYDISRTVRAFERIGYKPVSWRTHSYAGDKNTRLILPKLGFKNISEIDYGGIVKPGNPTEAPINVLNDDAIFLTQVLKEDGLRAKHLYDSIQKSIKGGMNPIITQLHPVLMQKFDGFETFRALLKAFVEHGYTFKTVRELIE